jgi:hypothetical protein
MRQTAVIVDKARIDKWKSRTSVYRAGTVTLVLSAFRKSFQDVGRRRGGGGVLKK